MIPPVLPSSAVTTPRRGPPGLSSVVRPEGAANVLVLRGDADLSTMRILSDAVAAVVALGAGDVIVDLGQVHFVDSGSIRVLVDLRQALEARGRRLTFRAPSRLAIRALEVYGVSGLIEPPATAPS